MEIKLSTEEYIDIIKRLINGMKIHEEALAELFLLEEKKPNCRSSSCWGASLALSQIEYFVNRLADIQEGE